jgi:hypothetical protein
MIGKNIGKLRGKAVLQTDHRVKLMNEVLSCIKLIKMYAWEKSFAKMIGGKKIYHFKSIKDL